MLRDPVCGMQIQAAEAYVVRHVGDAHFALCSAACAAQFDAAPQRYMQLVGHPATVRHAGGTPLLRPLAAGGFAVLGLLIFYLGIITLAQDWKPYSPRRFSRKQAAGNECLLASTPNFIRRIDERWPDREELRSSFFVSVIHSTFP
jgi:YHS domain-containing protein